MRPSGALWGTAVMRPEIPLDVCSRGGAENAEQTHTIQSRPKSFSLSSLRLRVSAPPRDTFFGRLKPNAGRQPRAVFSRVGWTGLFGIRLPATTNCPNWHIVPSCFLHSARSRAEFADPKMTETTALPWWSALLDDNTEDLSIVWHNCGECSLCLRPASTALKRIQNIFQPVVDVVNHFRASIEVEMHANLQSIGTGVNDSLPTLHSHDRGVKIPAPNVSRRSIGWHSNMQPLTGLGHRAS